MLEISCPAIIFHIPCIMPFNFGIELSSAYVIKTVFMLRIMSKFVVLKKFKNFINVGSIQGGSNPFHCESQII